MNCAWPRGNAARFGCELLLATPLTSNQIVQGQWRALLRMFGAPLVVLVAAQLLGTILVQQMTWSRLAAVTPSTPTIATTTNTIVATPIVTGSNEIVSVIVYVAGTLTFVANLAALCWFGRWMGLNSKTNNLATLKTIVFVQVIPWFVVSFSSVLVVPMLLLKGVASSTSQIMTWLPLLTSALAALLFLTKDVVFSLWARHKLYSEFREQAMRSVSPILPALPPPLPRRDLPPVIAPN